MSNLLPTQDISGINTDVLEERRIKYILELCEVVMRQTDYDLEKAKEKVRDFKGDIVAIVREYMNPPPKPDIYATRSPNQIILTEIRTMMDDAASKYRYKKDLEERKKVLIERIMTENQRKEQEKKETDNDQ
jgi:hypothetical protein